MATVAPVDHASGQNLTILVKDVIDYFNTKKRDDSQNDPGARNQEMTSDFYQDLFESQFGKGTNLSGLSWEDIGADLILGGQVPEVMIKYVKYRPYIQGSMLVLSTLVGICANVVLIVLLVRKGWGSLSYTSILLVNLAVACLLFLIAGMPLLLVENVFGYGWKLGEVTCQAHRYLIYVSFFCISYAVVLVLLYQLLALCSPDRVARYDNPGHALCVCGALWAIILAANIPNFLGHGITEEVAGISYCFNKDIHNDLYQTKAWTLLHFMFSFALPFVLMCACSFSILLRLCTTPPTEYSRLREDSRERREYATLAIIITITFAICWAPDKIFSLVLVLHPTKMDAPTLIASDVMMILAYSNPSVNPFIILFSGLKEVKRNTTSAVVVKRMAPNSPNCKQDTSLPLCAQEEVPDPEMITTV